MTSARIVVVEDNLVVARDIAQQLTRIGHSVVGATARGEEALALTLASKPNLVLMDIRLEGDLDGIEAAERIREHARVPVIFLTAYADDPTVRRASRAEPFGYLIKPFDDAQLRTAIEMALSKHAAEQRLRESERRFAVTLSSIGDAVIATDARGEITFMNPVAEALTGFSMSETAGLPLASVFRIVNEETRLTVEDPAAKVLRLGTTVGLANHTVLLARDGREIAIDDSGAPIFDDDGAIVGVVLVFRDVTTRRQAEQAELLRKQADVLRLANERLELALQGSDIAMWEFLLSDGSLETAQIRGASFWHPYGFHDGIDFATVAQRWHPDDRERVISAIRAYLAGETDHYALECRMLRSDGEYRTRMVRGVAVRDASGKATSFIGTSVDITERKRLESELEAARDAAEASNRAKDEFLANVSHEIRTPMNAILGMTELVLDTALDEGQRRSLRTVESAAASMLAIINDLLDFSKIEAGKMELDPAEFPLRALLGDTLGALAVRAQRKSLALAWEVAPEVPDVLVGDAGRLRQVLINLVGNAIKFTARGEVRVDVTCGAQADRDVELRFRVRDTGIGIPSHRQASIFRAFEQEDMSTTRRYGGTGLGLTIAARFVEMMGGAITVESTPGQGSTFRFAVRFPLGDHATASRAPFEASLEPLRIDDPPPSAVAGASLRASTVPLRVLVAEDNPFNSLLLEQLLSSRGHAVRVARDGDQALAYALSGGFDLLLLDLHMPERDGFQVIEALREHERGTGAHLLTIALTARSRAEDRARCFAAGMDEFLAKPIHAAALWAAIDRIRRPTMLARRAPVAGADDALIDADVLLAACGGDPVVLEAIRRGLHTRLPEALSEVERALGRADAARLREAAHTLHGMLSAFSSLAGGVASLLEDAALAGDLSGAAPLVERLRTLAPALIAAVDASTIASLSEDASHRS